jgi:hypothetical protein
MDVNMPDGQLQNDVAVLPKLNAYNYENLFKVYRDDADSPYYYNILNTIVLPEAIDPAVYYDHTIPGPNISWTNLSYQIYGTIRLWWIICLANNIQDPTSFPAAGSVLKIIRPEYVREILATIKQSQ